MSVHFWMDHYLSGNNEAGRVENLQKQIKDTKIYNKYMKNMKLEVFTKTMKLHSDENTGLEGFSVPKIIFFFTFFLNFPFFLLHNNYINIYICKVHWTNNLRLGINNKSQT